MQGIWWTCSRIPPNRNTVCRKKIFQERYEIISEIHVPWTVIHSSYASLTYSLLLHLLFCNFWLQQCVNCGRRTRKVHLIYTVHISNFLCHAPILISLLYRYLLYLHHANNTSLFDQQKVVSWEKAPARRNSFGSRTANMRCGTGREYGVGAGTSVRSKYSRPAGRPSSLPPPLRFELKDDRLSSEPGRLSSGVSSTNMDVWNNIKQIREYHHIFFYQFNSCTSIKSSLV